MNKPLSIYVHIPFCIKKCDYCSFISLTNFKLVKDYFLCLEKEIKNYILNNNLKEYSVKSIYFGGGTPSSVEESYICSILKLLKNNLNINRDAEITIEINPSTNTLQKLVAYKKAGFNRVSIGIQSMCNKSLQKVGRIGNKKLSIETVKNAKKAGFKNISCDIMLGLPNSSFFSIKNDLRTLINLDVKHFSCYMLMVEENTKLKENIDKKRIKTKSDEECVKYYNKITKFLKKHNIFRYEVSNFSYKGYESIHNLGYWSNREYIGFGLSSHSYFNKTRYANTENMEEYINNLKNNKSVVVFSETLDLVKQKEEFVMLSLRKSEGIDIKEYNNLFNCDFLQEKQNKIKKINDFIEIKNNFLYVKEEYFSILNSIILELV